MATDSYNQVIGTYSGTGVTRAITGLGFRPQAVIVKSTQIPNLTGGAIKTDVMAGDLSILIATFTDAHDGIVSLDSDGFTVGTGDSANASGIDYTYIAIYDGGLHGEGFFFHHGSYVGNGADNRNIVIDAGWQPSLVLCSAAGFVRRDSTMVGDFSIRMLGSSAVTDQIQAMNADGFQVGATLNQNAVTYYWLAWQGTALDSLLVANSYVGDGNSTQLVNVPTPARLVPLRFVLADKDAVTSFFKSSVVADPDSAIWESGRIFASTAIRSLGNGVFQVGSTLNTSGQTFHYVAMLSGSLDVAPKTIHITGSLYNQHGEVITFGRLVIKPKNFITQANELFMFSANTVYVNIPPDGVLSFFLAPSNGVLYVVEYDSNPSDLLTPVPRKIGYFRDVWDVPENGPIDIATL